MARAGRTAGSGHVRDVLALGAGIVYTSVGLTYLLGGGHAVGSNGAWLTPVLLIILGAVGLVASMARPRRVAPAGPGGGPGSDGRSDVSADADTEVIGDYPFQPEGDEPPR